ESVRRRADRGGNRPRQARRGKADVVRPEPARDVPADSARPGRRGQGPCDHGRLRAVGRCRVPVAVPARRRADEVEADRLPLRVDRGPVRADPDRDRRRARHARARTARRPDRRDRRGDGPRRHPRRVRRPGSDRGAAVSLAVAQEHRAMQAGIAQDAARRVAAAWAEGVDPDNIRESWRLTLPQAVGITTAAQYAAARAAESYLQRVIPGEPAAGLNARALAGVASDGRDLSSLLAQPAITVLTYLAGGRALADAMAAAVAALELIVGTQVSDAGRGADLVGMAARPRVVAYTRVVNLPACARCILLAGQTYAWSEGFARHPRCDCEVLPLTDDDPAPFSPRELFEQMSPDEQVRRFGAAGAEAIREGADLGQVVNARRGMSVAGARLVTREGMTRRGYAGRRLGSTDDRGRFRPSRAPRLMPEQIIAEADGDRGAAIEALIRYGFLTPRREDAAPAPVPEPVVLTPPAPSEQALPDPPTMADADLESELAELMQAGDFDSPRFSALMAEMDRREQAGRDAEQAPDVEPEQGPVDGSVTAADLAWHDDERLSELLLTAFAEGRTRDAAVIEAAIDRRAEAAEAPP